MKPDFELVGVGGGLALPNHVNAGLESRNTSILLRPDPQTCVMVDVGITNVDVAIQNEVTHVVITHMHPDHIGGLALFLLHRKYVQKHLPKPILLMATFHEPFDIWESLLKCQLAYDTRTGWHGERIAEVVGLDAFATLVQFTREDMTGRLAENLTVSFYESSFQAHHIESMPAFGLRFGSKLHDDFIIYTADTMCNDGANVLRGGRDKALLIMHDISFKPASAPNDVHAHITELLATVPDQYFPKIAAMHHGPLALDNPHVQAFQSLRGLLPGVHAHDMHVVKTLWTRLMRSMP